ACADYPAPASALAERVALDVSAEIRLVGVGPLLEVGELAAAVVVGGAGKPGKVEVMPDVLAGIADARVGNRVLGEEGLGGVLRVKGVDADEGDPLAELCRDVLEERELEAAGTAPGGPDVGDHRVPPQLCQLLRIGVAAARDQLVGM